jgi:hypothetical protein
MTNKLSNSQPENSKENSLKRIQKLAHLLDNAFTIPGTSYNIGLDPLLGLFPAMGDYIGFILSGYIVWESAKLGVSKSILYRMTLNIIIDFLGGIFPFFGDIFDVMWKANQKNTILLENYLKSPEKTKKVNKLFLLLLFTILFIFVTTSVVITIFILKFIWELFYGIN